MAYDDEDMRRAARERLEERMRRRGGQAGNASRSNGHSSSGARSNRTDRTTASENHANRGSTLLSSLGDRLSLPKLIAIAAIAVVLIAIFATTCSGNCGGGAQPPADTDSSVNMTSPGAEETSEPPAVKETPQEDELIQVIGEDEAAKLIEQAESDDDALWIAAHPDELAFDGPEVQAKILKLAADDPMALPFVRDFANQYPQDEPTDDASLALSTGSPSSDVPDTAVPHLYQWDRRWGYTVYNADAFGLSGCGPTSLAMVYQALTGDTGTTPYDMGQMAYDGGYVIEWVGTANTFFTETAGQLGLYCETIPSDAASITSVLASGQPIIANVGKGYFSNYGHFFVLAGLTDDGQIIINDPYSATRSSQAWDPELIASESIALYAYALA